MAKKQFQFDDDIENVSDPSYQLQEDHLNTKNNYQKKVIKKKTKVKKKIKRKNKTKKVRPKKSWISRFFLVLLICVLIITGCVGGYLAYDYYLKQQNQIERLEKQINEQKQDFPHVDENKQDEHSPTENNQSNEDNEMDDNPTETIPENNKTLEN